MPPQKRLDLFGAVVLALIGAILVGMTAATAYFKSGSVSSVLGNILGTFTLIFACLVIGDHIPKDRE